MGFIIAIAVFIGLIIWAKGIAKKDKEETKCTCKSCGNIWYYDGKEERLAKLERRAKGARDMIRIGEGLQGNTTPWLIPEVEKKDMINKCPKCNFSGIVKEQVA